MRGEEGKLVENAREKFLCAYKKKNATKKKKAQRQILYFAD